MNRAPLKMRRFAEHLIAHEARAGKASRTPPGADFPVVEKMRPLLANLMGDAGFRALVSRAFALASAELPWLRKSAFISNDALERFAEVAAKIGPKELDEGRVVLLAQLLGLLVAFIGEKLTLQLVLEALPKLILNDLNFVE